MSLGKREGTNSARQWPEVAVVGCGAWGRNLARNFNALGVLAAVHDRHSDRATSVASNCAVRAVRFDELLADKSIQAVALATPSHTHFALAREALVAAKHVFVEKPMALDPDHAAELNAIALRRRQTLMVGHLLRYHPAFERLTDLAERGDLGHINCIAATRLGTVMGRNESGVVWDLAPHDVSMILAMFHGMPLKVVALGDGQTTSLGSDAALAALEFADGREARLHISWRHPTKQRRFTVIGSDAIAVFDDDNDWPRKLMVWRTRRPAADGTPIPLTPLEPLAAECRHFLDCVRFRRPPRTDGREALAVLQVLKAIEQSIVAQTPIKVGITVKTRAQALAE